MFFSGMKRGLWAWCACGLAWAAPSVAWAEPAKVESAPKQDVVVKPCSEGYVQVDGFVTDWDDAPAMEVSALVAGEPEYDWTGPKDLSMRVQAQRDSRYLYLAIEVRDNVISGPKGRGKGDRVELWFDGGEAADPKQRLRMIELGLGEMADGGKPSVKLRGKELDGALKDGAIRVKGNYFFEIGIPLSALSEPAPGLEPLGMVVLARDWDHDDPNEDEAAVSSAHFDGAKHKDPAQMGRLVLRTWESVAEGFYKKAPDARGLKPVGEAWVDVGGDSRRERVVLAGKYLAVLGEGLGEGEYYFYTLPSSADHRTKALELRDLTGDGKAEMLVTYDLAWPELGVTQELVAVYHFDLDKLLLVFQAEVGNIGPGWELRNKLDYVIPKKGKPSEIRVSVQPTKNAPALESYVDVDKDQVVSWDRILLPWQEGRARTYTWGDSQFLKEDTDAP
jgi:hypothetical protein